MINREIRSEAYDRIPANTIPNSINMCGRENIGMKAACSSSSALIVCPVRNYASSAFQITFPSMPWKGVDCCTSSLFMVTECRSRKPVVLKMSIQKDGIRRNVVPNSAALEILYQCVRPEGALG
jgi:hypothetical protein